MWILGPQAKVYFGVNCLLVPVLGEEAVIVSCGGGTGFSGLFTGWPNMP